MQGLARSSKFGYGQKPSAQTAGARAQRLASGGDVQWPSNQAGKGRLVPSGLVNLGYPRVRETVWQPGRARAAQESDLPLGARARGGNSATQPVKGRLGLAERRRGSATWALGRHRPGRQGSPGRRSVLRAWSREIGRIRARRNAYVVPKKFEAGQQAAAAPDSFAITPSRPVAHRDGVGGGHKLGGGRVVVARRRAHSSA